MLKRENIHRALLEAIEKKIPEKTNLVELLMELLSMEKGAVYRRLRGEVPFTFFEVANIAERLDISLSNLISANSVHVDHFELSIIEYANMSDFDYQQWEDYLALIGSAKDDPHSEIAESSNVLPLSVYAGFDSLSKFFLFKYQYLFGGIEHRISFDNLVFPERLNRIFRTYFNVSRNIAKSIYIWDHLIFRYLVNDIRYFSGINLISKDNVRQIRNDLLALLDYIEEIALKGCFEETGNPVSFYISDINLDADYSYVQFNDMRIGHVRTFILNSVASTDHLSFQKIKDWIQSLTKSSILITQSGAVHRADFFDKQRMMVSEL